MTGVIGKIRIGWVFLLVLAGSAMADEAFRVTPYVQNPSADAVTLIWFSNRGSPGEVRWGPADDDATAMLTSQPQADDALRYHALELDAPEPPLAHPVTAPWRHEVRLSGVRPGVGYTWRVTQDGARASGRFRVPAETDSALRFIAFADSETEPESTGKFSNWPDAAGNKRAYLVDQTDGYAANLGVIAERKPDFIAIAGDLVQSGGEQRDWDEFWRHIAPLAASTFVMPTLGNHDYFAGPQGFGRYATEDSERAVAKYRSYFSLPGNGSGVADDDERYYALRWGPVSLISLDLNNGRPNRGSSDTNWHLLGAGEGGVAPDWQPGSRQHRWLKDALEAARRDSAFTFVMFHHCPYSSGPHARPPGEWPEGDDLSGVPLRALTPLFMEYGVDVLLTGHDEMFEHSIVEGEQILADGESAPHRLHVFDVGVGGDGLRGPMAGIRNPHRVFLAHEDAPEVRAADGRLLDGGKHYGHLEVNVERSDDGAWRARLDKVYVFPVTAADGRVLRFERRIYPGETVLTAPE
ncbi:MAG: metallophosphoesterase [Xanthomonadales bacterium]